MNYEKFKDSRTGVTYDLACDPCVPNPRGTYTDEKLPCNETDPRKL